MRNSLTIGTIWEENFAGETTPRKYELVAISPISGVVQLSGIDGNHDYTIISEPFLRQNYKLISLKK